MSSENIEPRWVSQTIVQAIHTDQIRQHGGSPGLRDRGLLESALHRAPNHWHYDKTADLFVLAAVYGIGLAKNHAFVDGNKRVSFQIMYIFLGLNNLRIVASELEVVKLMLSVADGTIDEKHLAQWLRDHTEPR